MNDQPSSQLLLPPLSEAAIPADEFHRARAANEQHMTRDTPTAEMRVEERVVAIARIPD